MTTVLLCNQNVYVNDGFEFDGVEMFCERLDGHTGNHVHEDDDGYGNRFRVEWWGSSEEYTEGTDGVYE